jgi:hypothetical protein
MQGTCPECGKQKVSLQSRVKIGASNDPLESEADRIADRVLSGRLDAAPSISQAQVQHHTEVDDAHAKAVPSVVDEALAGPCAPLERGLRRHMEERFGRDFSGVRVHADSAAARSADAVGANAYTAGSHIVFAHGQFAPQSSAGRHLLAHELTHVVQQASAGMATGIQRDDKKKKDGDADGAKGPFKTGEKICGRPTRENIDFPNTRISRVDIDLSSANLTISWNNPKGLTNLPTGPFKISAGAGKCCVDCDDKKVSETVGSLCTPKGTSFVRGKGCELSSATWAKNPTFFSVKDDVAIHAGPLPAFHASHGCVRTTEEASEIVHDNSVFSQKFAANEKKGRPEGRTEVAVTGTWTGEECYKPGVKDSVSRASECTKKAKPKAKPKPKSKPESKPKQKAAADVPTPDLPSASDLELDAETLAEDLAMDDLRDGPGPA